MALSIGLEKLRAALALLAAGDGPGGYPAATRLQAAWNGPIAELWEGMYLPADPNEQFKQMRAELPHPRMTRAAPHFAS